MQDTPEPVAASPLPLVVARRLPPPVTIRSAARDLVRNPGALFGVLAFVVVAMVVERRR